VTSATDQRAVAALDRAADRRKKGRPRYIYFRRGLERPITGLEQAFHESDAEEE
jgi:hypothetical protein